MWESSAIYNNICVLLFYYNGCIYLRYLVSQFEVDYVVCAVVFGQQADMTPITKAAIKHVTVGFYSIVHYL